CCLPTSDNPTGCQPDASPTSLSRLVECVSKISETVMAPLLGRRAHRGHPSRIARPLPFEDLVVERPVEMEAVAATLAEPGVRRRHLFGDTAPRLPAQTFFGLGEVEDATADLPLIPVGEP